MKKKWYKEFPKHLFLLFVLACALFPLYLMVNISLKTNAQFNSNPWWPEGPFHFAQNYAKGWGFIGAKIFNTTYVAFTGTLLSIVLAVTGAFFFARYKMPGSTVLFYFFMFLMLYPGVANMVPTFKLISSLGLYNSYWALILLGTFGGQAFLIFVLRAFIEDVPKDIFDAAEIDGCNTLQQIWHIVVPLSMPVIGVLAVLQTIGAWNNFVAPLILIRDDYKQLLSVSLLRLEGDYVRQWGPMMAGYTIASIPLIVIFALSMRLFIRGLSEGAIKG